MNSTGRSLDQYFAYHIVMPNWYFKISNLYSSTTQPNPSFNQQPIIQQRIDNKECIK